MKDLSPVLFRGDHSNRLLQVSWQHPCFFAERVEHAARYVRHIRDQRRAQTQVSAVVIQGERFVDLTVDVDSPTSGLCELGRSIINEVRAAFDDWSCRISGEPRDLLDFLAAGNLYDYEGTGSGHRWNTLIDTALQHGVDALKVLDITDAGGQAPSMVWVTGRRGCVRAASPGEELAARVASQPMEDVLYWLERNDPGLFERLSRLRNIDEESILSRMAEMPLNEYARAMKAGKTPRSIWRALPHGACIRPGDWVAQSLSYAQAHVRLDEGRNASSAIDQMRAVHGDDIAWAGTDTNEFFYLPSAWRMPPGTRADEALKLLGAEKLRMLADGEHARLLRFRPEILRLRDTIHAEHMDRHQRHGLDAHIHGPSHWSRVEVHAQAVARSAGVDPLVPTLFAMVHDSQRENDDLDPGHGPRAAGWIAEHRHTLFGFLADEEVNVLQLACDQHSEGVTDGPLLAQVCWDADRLDLWRVHVQPDPDLLCTEYARRKEVIFHAADLAGVGRGGLLTQRRQAMRG